MNAYNILGVPELIRHFELELTRVPYSGVPGSGLVAALRLPLPLPARPCLQIRYQLFSGAGKERLDFPPTSTVGSG